MIRFSRGEEQRRERVSHECTHEMARHTMKNIYIFPAHRYVVGNDATNSSRVGLSGVTRHATGRNMPIVRNDFSATIRQTWCTEHNRQEPRLAKEHTSEGNMLTDVSCPPKASEATPGICIDNRELLFKFGRSFLHGLSATSDPTCRETRR